MKNKELAVVVSHVQKDKDIYFGELFTATWETVYFLSLKMMSNESDAEDIAQDIFVKIYNNIDTLESPEAFNRWMNRIVMNTCNRALRKHTNKLQTVDSEDIDKLSDFVEEDNTEFLPAALVDSKETREIIEKMVQELPEKQRQAVLMYYYEEMNTTEIAQTLDCAITAVNKRLHNAKATLRLKIEGMQKEQDIKLYSVSTIPVLTIILKACAEDSCTNSVKASLWNGISNSIGVKPESSPSNTSSTIVSQVLAVVVMVILIINSTLIVAQIVNQPTKNTNLIPSDEAIEDQSETEPTTEDSLEESDQTKEDIFLPDGNVPEDYLQQTNPQNPNSSNNETIIQGNRTATISTLSNEMVLPAGSIVTNHQGDRTYLSRTGIMDFEGKVKSDGTIVTIPNDKVSQIEHREDGNMLLPIGSSIKDSNGTITQYLGHIMVNREYNTIKKLPVEIDLKDGNITIIEKDGQLIINQNGNDIIVNKDTVLNIVNTSNTIGTVVVDGCEVEFDNIDGNLEVVNSGKANVVNDVTENVETTTKGKTTIEGSVGGNVTTEGEASMTTIGQGVNGEIRDTNGGQSNITESNPNKTLPTPNVSNIQPLVLKLLINLVLLGVVVILIIKKMKEEKKMGKVNKVINKISLLSLSFLLVGTIAVPKVSAQENETIDENIPVTEEDVTTVSQEIETTGEVINTSEENTSRLPETMNVVGRTTVQPLVDSVEGVTTLKAGETTLGQAFPDENFRKYVAETVLGKSAGSYDGNTMLTQGDIDDKILGRATVDVNNKNISSMEGIQHFVNLEKLYCDNNNLKQLNISNLGKLVELRCYQNQISELDVSNLTNLEDLRCQQNQISVLNVSNLNKLLRLRCNNNQINELDVSNLTNLVELTCYVNKISDLDVTNLINLTILKCYDNQISELDVSKLINLIELHCFRNQIRELNVTNLINLTNLSCHSNKISQLDVLKLTKLTQLVCYINEISELDVSKLDNLQDLRVYSNPISQLNISELAKKKITSLHYRSTNIDSLDLLGFTALIELNITGSTNADLSRLTSFYISGSRGINDAHLVRLSGNVGAFSWDSTTGYYVIKPNMNAKYGFNVPSEDSPSGLAFTPIENYLDLPNGGIVDHEGNLIIGATLADVQSDGSIKLPNSGTIVTAEGTYTFDGSVSIKDGVIATNDNYSFAKNTATYDPETGIATANVGAIVTTVEVGNGTTTINTIGSDMDVPKGTVVTNDSGDKTYLTGVGQVDSEGNVTSGGSTITVPANKVDGITVDEDGNTVLPGGSIVTNPGGSTIVYNNSVIIDKDGNFIDPTKLVNSLLTEDKTDVLPGVNQDRIDSAQKAINLLTDGEEKSALQADIDLAQLLLNNRNDAITKVGNLLNPGVTQGKIDEAQKAVNLLPNGQLKDTLQIIIDIVQETLNNVLNMDKANELLELISKLDLSLYTTDSLTKLNEALQQMLSSETYLNQATLDEAVAKLQSAYDGLVLLDTNSGENSTINPDKGTDTITNKQTGATNTGDETSMQSLILMSLISIGVFAASVVNFKKREQH